MCSIADFSLGVTLPHRGLRHLFTPILPGTVGVRVGGQGGWWSPSFSQKEIKQQEKPTVMFNTLAPTAVLSEMNRTRVVESDGQ